MADTKERPIASKVKLAIGDYRGGEHRFSDAAFGVVMKIRTADSDAPDPDLDLSGRWRRRLRLDLAELAWGRQFADAHYFLNRLSKAARASDGVRTSEGVTDDPADPFPDAASRITVTFGVNSSQSLAWSL